MASGLFQCEAVITGEVGTTHDGFMRTVIFHRAVRRSCCAGMISTRSLALFSRITFLRFGGQSMRGCC